MFEKVLEIFEDIIETYCENFQNLLQAASGILSRKFFCIIYLHCNFGIFRRDLLPQPNYIYVQGQRQDFGSGDIGQNFIHDFLSSPVLQWRRQNFGSVGTFSKIVLIKDFLKNVLNL